MLLASWYDRNSLVLQDQAQLQTDSDLWLLAEGRSSTMITSRMVENRRRQKASSTHKSLHPCGKDTNKNTEMDVIRLQGKFFTLHLCIREKPTEMTRPRNLNRMQQQKTNWPSGSPPAWRLWWSRWWIWWKLSTQSKQRCYSDVCKRQSILEQLVLTDNREDESVGEVLIQREFHYVSPKLQEASGLRQADENVDVN